MILVLAATGRELDPLRRHLQGLHPVPLERPAFGGEVAERRILAAETGVGKSNASIATLDLVKRFEARAVIQVGCAGAFRETGLSVGDVVIADREIFADEGAATPEGFLDLRRLGLPLGNAPSGDPVYNEIPVGLPALDLAALERKFPFSIRVGPIATVSTCSGTDRRAREVYDRWRPLAEAMEGAAAAWVALRFHLPFLEIRGVSNFAGDRRHEVWNVPAACANAAEVAVGILKEMDEDEHES